MSVSLVEVEPSDFAWLGIEGAGRDGLRAAPGGVDDPEVLPIVRRVVERLHAAGSRAAWMIVANDEVVGLCSALDVARAGTVEIGYGVAASRRGRGYARAAIAAMLEIFACDPALTTVTAHTALANSASQIVLERNGFTRGATRVDPDDGEIVRWQRSLRT